MAGHGGRPLKAAASGEEEVAASREGLALDHVLTNLPASNPLAVVLPAHPGAGASTVALALGIAVAERNWSPQLIECSTPEQSGLAAATDTELGTNEAGWRFGTRGCLTVHRPATTYVAGAPTLPDRRATPVPTSVLILDPACWSTALAMDTSWASGVPRTAQMVLVLRASVPGVQAAERILARLAGRTPLVAVLGPARWPGVVTASRGPLLRGAAEEGRIVPLPVDDHLAVTGLTADPLPKAVLAAARVLAGLAFPESAAT
jgi:hypothetical protein